MNDPFSWHDSNFKCHDTLGLLLTSCLYVSRHCTEESFFHLLCWGISGWSWAHPRRRKSICYQLPATKFVHLRLLSSTPEVCHKWFLLLKFTPWPLCDTSALRDSASFSPPPHFDFIVTPCQEQPCLDFILKLYPFPFKFSCALSKRIFIYEIAQKTDLDMAFSIYFYHHFYFLRKTTLLLNWRNSSAQLLMQDIKTIDWNWLLCT